MESSVAEVSEPTPSPEPQTNGTASPAKPVLATSVVGSYSVPEWLERLKTDFYQRRISGQYLDDIHEVAIKAALKDQERAGVDVVSDGELRRDNDIDYFLARMPGVEITHAAKTFYWVWSTICASPWRIPTGRSNSRSPVRSRSRAACTTRPTTTSTTWSSLSPAS
jgi:methionine synthase II (cobalamin-independent)